MTDIISLDNIQILTLGRIYYYGFLLKLFDHYSCDEYFANFIENVQPCFFSLSLAIFICPPKKIRFLVYIGMWIYNGILFKQQIRN